MCRVQTDGQRTDRVFGRYLTVIEWSHFVCRNKIKNNYLH